MTTHIWRINRNKIIATIILLLPILLFIYHNWFLSQKLDKIHIYLYYSLYTICIIGLYNNLYIFKKDNFINQIFSKELLILFILFDLSLYTFFINISITTFLRFQISLILTHINIQTFLFFASKKNQKKVYEILYSSLIFISNLQMFAFLTRNVLLMNILEWTPINLIHLNTFFNPTVLSISFSLLSITYFYLVNKLNI